VPKFFNNFFHPDYTVGFGFAPNRSVQKHLHKVAGLKLVFITAGEELHLAPKFYLFLILRYVSNLQTKLPS
jgi:hypothetical protein